MRFRFGTLLLVLAALTLLTASRVYLSLDIKGFEVPVSQILVTEATRWGLWIPIVPAILALDRRVGYDAKPPLVATSAHAAGCLIVLLGHSAIMAAIGQPANWYFALPTPGATYTTLLVHETTTLVLAYAAVLAQHHVRRHLREGERRRVAQASLESRLAQERLRNLQMQLHPHFLFNTLHAVGGLIREGDRDLAVQTVSELADLLRRSLRNGQRQQVTLDEELDFLGAWLRIQQARYGSRLEVRIDADGETRAALVPHLVLQPFVENAIRHGASRAAGPGIVSIHARAADGRLRLRVRDNGPGLEAGWTEGIGVGNTRARLDELYDGDFELELASDDAGTVASIDLPFRRGDAAERVEDVRG